jgi:hypothetical protein
MPLQATPPTLRIKMGLTAAAVAYKDDGLGPGDVTALREFVNLLRRDLRVS